MDIRQIELAAHSRFPEAVEISVRFLLHHVKNYLQDNDIVEGICQCSLEGYDLRKQFTAKTPIELAKKIMDNDSDWDDYHRFINPGISERP